MKKPLFSLISLVAVSSLIFINLIIINQPLIANADSQLAQSSGAALEIQNQINDTANNVDIDLPGGSAENLAGEIINTLLAFLGVFFLILTIYAGFLWMTASGDEKKTTKAKDILKNAVTGLLIIAIAYLLVNFVIFTLLKV